MTRERDDWVSPHLPTAPLENLRRRAQLLRKTREFFDERDFFEVTTPALSADTMVDPHIEPIRVRISNDPRQSETGPTWFLQTSPEFHMKRLLAAGATAIYQIGPAFRAAESGEHHNIEFTMLEWYRCGDDMAAGMALLAELARLLFACDDVDRATYQEAFIDAVSLDPHTCDVDALKQRCAAYRSCDADARDDLLHLLWNELVEPSLGFDRPVIIYDFPASQAALANVRDGNVPVAERFELYFQGVELANGYHELTDLGEFRKRLQQFNRERAASGKELLPENNQLARAMEVGLPPSVGVAMGFDRVAMLAMGETEIRRVIPFPGDRA